jgi:tetratricopeptide (TPR) repeat protein
MELLSNRTVRRLSLSLALLAVVAPRSWSQDKSSGDAAAIEGTVFDSQNRPAGDASVSLENDSRVRTVVVRTDVHGHYRFEGVLPGTYMLRVTAAGHPEGHEGPFVVQQKEVKTVVLHLAPEGSSASAKDALSAVEFSDEPKFSVAGVTDPSNLGGHGSDTVLRTKETLAKETANLTHEAPSSPKDNSPATDDLADTHARRGDEAERAGHSLEAVQEFQRAAELQPNEAHLFAWGAELLLHRAFEPAIEVFTKGRRLYPDSVRILLGLSVATYDRGAAQQGEELLLAACDLHPSDATPYLFLGKLQDAEKIEPAGWTERLKRFATLHPDNALAHYYYAVALGKQNSATENYGVIQTELQRAIELDPRLGDAHLQLGILYSEKKDFPAAINAFEKAIERLTFPDEAHYRLAQIYRQAGDTEKARIETALYNQTSQQKTQEAERRRHEIQQFVYRLRGQSSSSTSPATKPQ